MYIFIIFQPGQNYFIHSTRNAYLVYEYDIIYKELFDLARLSFGTLQSLYLLMGWVQLTQPENRIGFFFSFWASLLIFFSQCTPLQIKKIIKIGQHIYGSGYGQLLGTQLTHHYIYYLVCMCVSKYICSSSVMSLIITHY